MTPFVTFLKPHFLLALQGQPRRPYLVLCRLTFLFLNSRLYYPADTFFMTTHLTGLVFLANNSIHKLGQQVLHSGNHFRNGLRNQLKSCENTFCFYNNFCGPIRPQICTCHDSSSVMACANLWLDQIIIFHARTTQDFTRFWLSI